MEYLILSDTNFGIRNNDNFWLNLMLDYFQSEIIVYIKKYKPTVIHLGGLFHDKNNLNIKTINIVQKLFIEISKYSNIYFLVDKKDYIEDINNNVYCIFNNINNINIITDYLIIANDLFYVNNYNFPVNIKCNNYFTNNNKLIKDINYKNIISNKININSPYYINNWDKNCGYYLINNNEYSFIENKTSPKYIEYTINNDEDFDNLKNINTNNFIILNVNNNYYLSNKYKIDIFITKYKIFRYNIIKNEDNTENKKYEINYDYDVDHILDNFFNNNSLKDDFENIKNILKNKNI